MCGCGEPMKLMVNGDTKFGVFWRFFGILWDFVPKVSS